MVRFRPEEHGNSCYIGDVVSFRWTMGVVRTATVSELRDNGGEMLSRVECGERVIITPGWTPDCRAQAA